MLKIDLSPASKQTLVLIVAVIVIISAVLVAGWVLASKQTPAKSDDSISSASSQPTPRSDSRPPPAESFVYI